MPIHVSSSDYLGWNAQQMVNEIIRLKGLVNSNVDQYARNCEELQRENDRLTSENKTLTEEGLGLLNENQKLSQTVERLQKLVESQCIHNGHDVETIFYVGNPDPVSLTCRTCGKSWGVTAHD